MNERSDPMNRREFLKLVGGASLMAVTPCFARTPRRVEIPELEDEDMLKIVRMGLGKTTNPQTVIVIGAGMAGLVAAYELRRAGHRPLLIEAQDRVGGRVRTLREPFTFGLYAEAGAMRIPAAHTLTLAYVHNAPERGAPKIETAPFTMTNPNAYCFVRNKKHRWSEVTANPGCLGFSLEDRRAMGGFDERGKTPAQLWNETVAPLRERLKTGGKAAWRAIVAEYDKYSTRSFLEQAKWSEEAIQMFGLVENQQARLNNSVVSLLREKLTGSFQDLVELKGGMDQLPRSFLPTLQRSIYFGAKMEAIEQSPQKVTVTYRDTSGSLKQVQGDHAIIAIPFPLLRHVEGIERFSYGKQDAIQELNYDASAKILLQCRRRFWEEDEHIFGGGTESDLAIRSTWYPDHSQETGRGVLLVSYTWGRDAVVWGNLSPEERLREAVQDLARLHPQVSQEDDLIEGGTSVMWQNEPFAGGAFALFNPTQETLLHQFIKQPEGRIHFAGEHTSLNHRWIQGAIESGLRAAYEIHLTART
ncbi:MAG TPA: flavin monoamine oxidase family protein [Chthonomonadaceae bacterium]|nr:flavin monoamine oxidase family protein [Chthonomonadaceae bacterium]